MTDSFATEGVAAATPETSKLVRMREFGPGKGSTVGISIATALAMIFL